MNLKSNKAITLVALIITIIILLILAGVSLSMVLGDNGLINKAQSSVDKYQESASNEQSFLNELEKYIYSKGPITMVDVDTVFDQTGDVDGKLHVGDFVNYSAGSWDGDNGTEYKKIEESTGITPNNSTDLPTGNFQFGGFTSTSSRDGNATPNTSVYDYIKDKATGQAVTGWRVFDVEDGKITLISAGCPEDYSHNLGTNYGYISEYILTGNVNSRVTDSNSLGLGSIYKTRDWSMYLNSKYKTTGTATVLSNEKLGNWYMKYFGVSLVWNGVTSYGVIKETKYESLIDNYAYYWSASAYEDGKLYFSNCLRQAVYAGYDNAFGLRILITLPNTVKVSEESVGTKTITSRGADYTYNVWNIE